jgi:hypothetical protein
MSSPKKNNSQLNNLQIAVLALYELGGDQGAADTEDIAIHVDELAPGRFRWRKYEQHINLYTVLVSLWDAQKKGLVRGGVEKGWQLTPSGLSSALSLPNESTKKNDGTRKGLDRAADRKRRIETERLRTLPAASKYLNGEKLSLRDAEAVFRLDEYIREKRRRDAVNKMCMLFEGDEEITGFLNHAAELIRQER